jgi:tRNA threonylcarbamoyl adenosine modification protein YeaZ
MLILAFDTTSEKGGVGIFRDAECLVSVPNEGPANRYSITLFEMVEQALARAHLELREIDLYAAANGPGSFTGIRVGLAAARAWGKAFNRRVRGVSVLEAMVHKQGLGTRGSGLGETPASNASQLEGRESLPSPGGEGARRRRAGEGSIPPQGPSGPEWYFPILDARRGEFFVGGFRRMPSELPSATRQDYEPADGGWVLKPEPLRAFVEERLSSGASATCLVRAHDQAAVDLGASLPASLNWQQVEGALVDSIADIARKEEQSSRPCPDAKLDAYYIRRPDAEITWKG